MVYNLQREPLLKRLPTVIDRTYEVQAYDVDNLYPQRAEEVKNRSYTLKSAVERLAEFIDGEGFEDFNLATLILNSEGQTANEVLDIIAQDKACFNGIALHIKYNLNYKISEVTPIEFMFCRLGIPDENGHVHEIKYNTNWERDFAKTENNLFEIYTYPVFNPNPEVVKEQIAEYGFENYPGQILYWTPKPGIYPKAPFDPVFDNAQAQSEIGVFELASIQNGFTATTIFKYPGQFESDEKRREFKKKLDMHKGAKGAKSTIVVENPSGEELDLVETIQMQNTDRMFEFTSKNVKNAIRECLSMPAEILGQLPETGMFNQQQIQDAYTYVNAITRGHRNQIERIFQKILAHWKTPLQIKTTRIKPQAYFDQATAQPAAPSSQPGQSVAAPGEPTAAKPEFNEHLAGLTGKQYQNLMRIIRNIANGKMTREQGLAMLKMSFGFTEEQANALLIDIEDDDIDL